MNDVLASWRRTARVVALVVWIGANVGCGDGSPAPPKTYPVKGRVVVAKPEDLKPLVGSSVELQSAVDNTIRAYGEIQADGSFSFSTYWKAKNLEGAVEGNHQVRIILEMDDDRRFKKPKVTIPVKYARFETSGWDVTVPKNEELLLKVR